MSIVSDQQKQILFMILNSKVKGYLTLQVK